VHYPLRVFPGPVPAVGEVGNPTVDPNRLHAQFMRLSWSHYVIMWREGWKKCSAPQAPFTNHLISVFETLKIYSMKQRALRARAVVVKNTALLLSTS